MMLWKFLSTAARQIFSIKPSRPSFCPKTLQNDKLIHPILKIKANFEGS
jgi:hypothetical protein